MSDQFSDLGNQLAETAAEDANQEEESTVESENDENSEPETEAGPPFTFAEARQSSIYPLPETWQTYEQQTRFDVMLALRREGVMDLPKREIDEAMLQFATEHTDEIIERVAEARGIELEE